MWIDEITNIYKFILSFKLKKSINFSSEHIKDTSWKLKLHENGCTVELFFEHFKIFKFYMTNLTNSHFIKKKKTHHQQDYSI